jgi:Flp pilus assembly pilin Flp
MPMMLKRLLRDEDGAVTVDWVLLTALMVSLALAALTTVRTGTQDLSGDLGDKMVNYTIQTSFN